MQLGTMLLALWVGSNHAWAAPGTRKVERVCGPKPDASVATQTSKEQSGAMEGQVTGMGRGSASASSAGETSYEVLVSQEHNEKERLAWSFCRMNVMGQMSDEVYQSRLDQIWGQETQPQKNPPPATTTPASKPTSEKPQNKYASKPHSDDKFVPSEGMATVVFVCPSQRRGLPENGVYHRFTINEKRPKLEIWDHESVAIDVTPGLLQINTWPWPHTLEIQVDPGYIYYLDGAIKPSEKTKRGDPTWHRTLRLVPGSTGRRQAKTCTEQRRAR